MEDEEPTTIDFLMKPREWKQPQPDSHFLSVWETHNMGRKISLCVSVPSEEERPVYNKVL